MFERPSSLNKFQSKVTLSGHPIKETPWTLPYFTESICPTCRKTVKARKFVEDGKVFMEKECVEHGNFKVLLSPDANFYLKLFTHRYQDGVGILNPRVTGASRCPDDCGLCNMHTSHTCFAIIDVTETSFEQAVQMLKKFREIRPVPARFVQFRCDDPSSTPYLPELIDKAKTFGFSHVQIACKDFSEKAPAPHSIYFRSDDLSVIKEKIDICRKIFIKLVLAPATPNGAIVRLACESSDIVMGVVFEPANTKGSERQTLTHMAGELAKETGGLLPLDNWFPLGATVPISRLFETLTGKKALFASCHPDSCSASLIFVEPTKRREAKPLSDFFDIKNALDKIQTISDKKELHILKKFFMSSKSVNGLNFKKFMKSFTGIGYNKIFVIILDPHDAYNFDIERAKRGVFHKMAKDGRITMLA